MDGRGSSSSGGGSGTARKRGHQHHIRHEGTRRSNVPADEIIAALRAGDNSPTTIPSSADTEQTHRRSDMGTNVAVHNVNNNIYNVNEDDGGGGGSGDVTMLNDDDNRNNNNNNSNRNNNRTTPRSNASSRCPVSNANVLADSTNEWLNGIHLTSSGDATGMAPTTLTTMPSSVTVRSKSASRNAKLASSNLSRVSALQMEMDKSATKDYDPDQTDSVSSGSSTSNKKLKSKRDSSGKKSAKSTRDPAETAARKEKRSKRTKVAAPMEERPPLEGAAASDQWNEFDMADIENDPEAAEWSKLRCTSERTEVVAEREYRRQNRRCADYPGLAFGRSIFSSDTMMKLNIIRNELHNIMKTQLKRVRNKQQQNG